MADSIKDLLKLISRAATAKGVVFELHRKGKAHAIYHLGTRVTLPIPYSKVPERIRQEILRQCEPELGYRWWMPTDRNVAAPTHLPTNVAHGHRGPRG